MHAWKCLGILASAGVRTPQTSSFFPLLSLHHLMEVEGAKSQELDCSIPEGAKWFYKWRSETVHE